MMHEKELTRFRDPPVARFLFGSIQMAALWLVLRLYVGWQWLDAGRHKIEDPKWMETGAALQSYWQRAVAIPEQGRPAISFDWYRAFLDGLLAGGHYVWFAKLVAVGEAAIGVALILGAFTGVAAFFGAFMNWNFMMAGSASTNPLLFALAIGVILAWKIAGYWGLDRWVLPLLGTPWEPGQVWQPKARPQGALVPVQAPR